jgi:hypothetical protein
VIRTLSRVFCILALTATVSQTNLVLAQSRPRGSSPFSEITWDEYTFKFLPGNQMAQVLDADGHVIATILAMNGTLQILPTVTGDAAVKLRQSFQAWKEQGGEKALNNSTPPNSESKSPTSLAMAKPQPAAPDRPTSASTPSAAALSTSQADGQSTHGVLRAEDLERIGNAGLRFDLNAIRFDPKLLEQKPVMQYFIALNNCDDLGVQRALANELDYPALASFYSAKAAEILASLPDSAGIVMFRGNTKGGTLWGRSYGGYDPTLKALSLGQYDLGRKAFPILVSDKSRTFDIAGVHQVEENRSIGQVCPVAGDALARFRANLALPPAYTVTVPSMSFSELPMSESDARKYIESTNSRPRGVVLGVDLHLKPNPKKSSAKEFAFDGTIARVVVMDPDSYEPIGTLYDDHSLPPLQTKKRPSAITTMKSTREFNEEVVTAVYVSQAADACGWPLSPEQRTNLKRYISDVNTYGKFNDKSSLNGVIARVRNGINDPSRHFCENATERQDFDRRAATVWPKGPMAAPAP